MATENVKYLDSTIMQRLVTDMKTKLNEKIDKSEHIYKPGGSYSFANLPAPSSSNVGLVYNVTDRFTTTAAFIEGAGIEVEEGADVAVVMTSVDPPTYAYNLFGMSEPTDEMSQEEYEEMWKDPGVLELSRETVAIGGTGTSETVTVVSASGTVTAESSDTSVATVSASGNTITITSVAAGSATIAVSSAGSATHRATSKNIAVNVLTELMAGGNANIKGFNNSSLSYLRSFNLDVKYTDRYGIEHEDHIVHTKGHDDPFGYLIPILSGSDIYFTLTDIEDSIPFAVTAAANESVNLGTDTPITVKFKTPANPESQILGTIRITVSESYPYETMNTTIFVTGGLFGSQSTSSDFSIVGGISNTFTFQSSYGSPSSLFKLFHNGSEVAWNAPGPEAPFFDTPVEVRVGDTIAIKTVGDVTDPMDDEVNKWKTSGDVKLGNGNTVSYTLTASDMSEAGAIKVGFNGSSDSGYYTISKSGSAEDFALVISDT